MRDKVLAQLAREYPNTARLAVDDLIAPTLIAPVSLELPVSLWNEAERLVSLFYTKLRAPSPIGRASVSSPTRRASVLMSYDFHVDAARAEGERLRLIEINTNASMSLMTALVESAAATPSDHPENRLKKAILQDFADELGRPLSGAKIAIVDDTPKSQRLFIEFLLFQELFTQHGAEAVILDVRDLVWRDHALFSQDGFGPIDLVYNRSTDFYFTEPESAALKQAYESGPAVITPEPGDYGALADKARMSEWSRPGALEALGLSEEELHSIRSALIQTRNVADFSPDELWNLRKGLIFKPDSAFGGKAVFRGSSISRTPFQKMIDQNAETPFVAQEFVPAPVAKFAHGEYKYDLRFFAYRDRLGGACARLYQGQMTNATTVGGGVAAIKWLTTSV